LFTDVALCRYFHEIFLDTQTSPIQIGTERLFENTQLWDALKMLVQEELALYGSDRYPFLTNYQSDFAFESLFPVIRSIVNNHYQPSMYPASEKIVQDIGLHVTNFAERMMLMLTSHKQIKGLYTLLVQLRKHAMAQIRPDIISRLSQRLLVAESGFVLSKEQTQYVLRLFDD
jgi:hypothetical protein